VANDERVASDTELLAVFAEFEREMIIARVNAGMARAKKDGTKSGKPIGRPEVRDKLRNAAVDHLLRGVGILKTAKAVGLGTGTVQKINREMAPS
jgi:DNA invertase Pin-like site-specific DNA recombinase